MHPQLLSARAGAAGCKEAACEAVTVGQAASYLQLWDCSAVAAGGWGWSVQACLWIL